MCRFTLYLGPPLALSSLLTEPSHSLVNQSHQAQERPSPLNGDGFGVAWYGADDPLPGRYRSVRPAWNDPNLQDLARLVRSRAVLAHVRQASPGLPVTQLNCHPFAVGRWSFVHNGVLGGFAQVKRPLRQSLSDAAYAAIEGSTDSEHLFALFLDELAAHGPEPDDAALRSALQSCVARALELVEQHAPGEPSTLNLCATDGERAVVCRTTSPDAPRSDSLYLSQGARYTCEEGVCHMREPEAEGGAILVSSERLSDDAGWRSLELGETLVVGENLVVGGDGR